MKLLLDRGAELDRIDWNGRSALSWAVEDGSLAVVELLIKRGDDVEGTGPTGLGVEKTMIM
ncbi:hypothetical protein EMCG_04604 [[Emmonsia] crescens]|uniref:Uncharacterized protein n=1 Tax=[Emmonsia] crescens TaxID=73230 RepID=A0A0G2HSN0_9EURO|nr:hypothetical protein EMCG_04604 [Emmonsia crescens UAMH 3008]